MEKNDHFILSDAGDFQKRFKSVSNSLKFYCSIDMIARLTQCYHAYTQQ